MAEHFPEPTATIEFELADAAAVEAAVQEMMERGQAFVHGTRTEPWGQTVARFMSPEGVLVGLSYAPWLHKQEPDVRHYCCVTRNRLLSSHSVIRD